MSSRASSGKGAGTDASAGTFAVVELEDVGEDVGSGRTSFSSDFLEFEVNDPTGSKVLTANLLIKPAAALVETFKLSLSGDNVPGRVTTFPLNEISTNSLGATCLEAVRTRHLSVERQAPLDAQLPAANDA